VDLSALENDSDSKAHRFASNEYFVSFIHDDEVSLPLGSSQCTTWLLLPCADTDDDSIPAKLGSKTYIPYPSINAALQSLLIRNPTTRSGLPAGLPSRMGLMTHRLDIDAQRKISALLSRRGCGDHEAL